MDQANFDEAPDGFIDANASLLCEEANVNNLNHIDRKRNWTISVFTDCRQR
jgi:hypothetical protein